MSRTEAIMNWREAKFGLFVHWGVYSLLKAGEWVQYGRRIPVKEYEKLAAEFNPVRFSADEWVQLVKDAGMKYLILTSKHHDGFSMFKSNVSPFNIVDATPFGRDVIAELAEACRKGGIKLGFYYSHVREWRHPMAQSYEMQGRPDRIGNYGNFWDYPNENRKNLDVYIDEFDIPQLKELLTQYGDVMTIWFDTPSFIRPDQAERIKAAVYEAQPDCLINSRLSSDVEVDYKSMGDHEIPAAGSEEPWETAASAMIHWGYCEPYTPEKWEDLLMRLIDISSKGGNYLLNVGPRPDGVIPEDVQEQLRKLGAWLKVNGEAIYGTFRSPFQVAPEWGRITRKGNTLYLIVTDPAAREVSLDGLLTKACSCTALDSAASQAFTQTGERLTVKLTGMSARFRVVRVELEGEPEVSNKLLQDASGRVYLPASRGEALQAVPGEGVTVDGGGVTTGWFNPKDHMRWTFFVDKPGKYELRVITKNGFWQMWDFGHEINIELDEQILSLVTTDDGRKRECYEERAFKAGEAMLTAGRHVLTIAPEYLERKEMAGLTLLGVELAPMA